MTRPTIIDRDDVVVVPREATDEMLDAGNERSIEDIAMTGTAYPSDIFDVMIAASPHSSAWQEVREYVAGLERHVEELQAKIDPETDCACSYDEPGTVCDAHSPRVRELEKTVKAREAGLRAQVANHAEALRHIAALKLRLAEAELVIEPFAAVAENDIGEDEYDDDVFRPMSAKNARAQLINVGHLRAARAWKEGK